MGVIEALSLIRHFMKAATLVLVHERINDIFSTLIVQISVRCPSVLRIVLLVCMPRTQSRTQGVQWVRPHPLTGCKGPFNRRVRVKMTLRMREMWTSTT